MAKVMTSTIPSVAAWPMYLREELRAIPEVSSAFVGSAAQDIRLVIFVSPYNDEVIDKILNVEDRFSELYRGQRFRFDILANPKEGSPADVVPGVEQIFSAPVSARAT